MSYSQLCSKKILAPCNAASYETQGDSYLLEADVLLAHSGGTCIHTAGRFGGALHTDNRNIRALMCTWSFLQSLQSRLSHIQARMAYSTKVSHAEVRQRNIN